MEICDKRLKRLIADLAIDKVFVKGQELVVTNCWHFYTDGSSVDALFYDASDFKDGMNRIYNVVSDSNLEILAFCLMDTHFHFVLHGDYEICNRFIHEYIRRTSMYIQSKYGERNKLDSIKISHQVIDTDRYLKTVICYTLKNAPAGGLPYNALDYPWSSGPLMFRKKDGWAAPRWTLDDQMTSDKMSVLSLRSNLRCRSALPKNVRMIDGIVFPGEYVAYDIAEKCFKTHRSFNFFMCNSKEGDVESRSGEISHLTIPMQEMRQHKNDLCMELFGQKHIRNLDTTSRLKLARVLKSRYNSSDKQIVRLCGLIYDEVNHLL